LIVARTRIVAKFEGFPYRCGTVIQNIWLMRIVHAPASLNTAVRFTFKLFQKSSPRGSVAILFISLTLLGLKVFRQPENYTIERTSGRYSVSSGERRRSGTTSKTSGLYDPVAGVIYTNARVPKLNCAALTNTTRSAYYPKAP